MENEVKSIVARMLAMRGAVRSGLVSAVDPSNNAVKVRLQPSNTETTWMPVGSLGCGALRICRCPAMNEHVVLVPLEDNPEINVVLCSVFDVQVMPPQSPLTNLPAQPGEFFMQTGCDAPPALGGNKATDGSSPKYSTPWFHMTESQLSFGVGSNRVVLDASGLYITAPQTSTTGNLNVGTGITTTLTDSTGAVVDVTNGIITGKA